MPRGRKCYKPTRVQRTRVEELIAIGMTQSNIAASLGIDQRTLSKHFPRELRDGAAKKRGETVKLLWLAAKKGNVAAMKTLMALQIEPPQRETPALARSPKLGKKEVAQKEAESAGEGTDWGDDLLPPTSTSGLN